MNLTKGSLTDEMYEFVKANQPCSTDDVFQYMNTRKSCAKRKYKNNTTRQEICTLLTGDKRFRNVNYKIKHVFAMWVVVK